MVFWVGYRRVAMLIRGTNRAVVMTGIGGSRRYLGGSLTGGSFGDLAL